MLPQKVWVVILGFQLKNSWVSHRLMLQLLRQPDYCYDGFMWLYPTLQNNVNTHCPPTLCSMSGVYVHQHEIMWIFLSVSKYLLLEGQTLKILSQTLLSHAPRLYNHSIGGLGLACPEKAIWWGGGNHPPLKQWFSFCLFSCFAFSFFKKNQYSTNRRMGGTHLTPSYTQLSNWQYPRGKPGLQWAYDGVSSWQPLSSYYFSSNCSMVNIALSYHSISIGPKAKKGKSRVALSLFFSDCLILPTNLFADGIPLLVISLSLEFLFLISHPPT